MKKTLLTLMMLVCTLIAGAATQEVAHQKARPHKTEPVALSQNRKAARLGTAQSLNVSKSAARQAKSAEKTNVALNFSSSDFSYQWFEGDDASFWYFGCFDETGDWLIRLAYNTENQTGTVTYSDMNEEYSYLTFSNEDADPAYKEIQFAEGTQLSISEDEENVTITGTLVCKDCDSTFTVNAKCPKPQPQTYDIEGEKFTMASYDEDYKQWDLRFVDADHSWKIYLSLKSEDGKLAGTYTEEAISDDGCYAEDTNEDEDYAFKTMNVTITAPEGVTDPKTEGCEITGTAQDEAGNTFNFHIKKEAPIKPKETKNIEVEVSSVEWPSETTGGSYYEVTEKNNYENRWVLSLTQKTGTSSCEEFDGIDTTATYRINTPTGKQLHVNNGTITQTFDSQKLEIAVEVALVMNDSIQYNFSFTTPVNKEGEETLNFTDLQIDRSYSDYGSTTLNASNDNIRFSCELTDYATLPDEYTDDNCRIGLDIYKAGEEYSTYVSSNALIYANSTVDDNNVATFKAKFLGDDKIIYTIEATYVKPEITDTLTLAFDDENVEFGDNTMYEDSSFYFSYQPYGEESAKYHAWLRFNSSKVVGQYTFEQMSNNSMISYVNEYGMEKTCYFNSGNFTVTQDGKVYTLSGAGQAGNHWVKLSMKYTIQGYEYDDYENDVDVTFAKQDSVEFSPDDVNSAIYVKLLNKSRNDEICLLLFPETYESGMTTIPAATYEIGGWFAPYAQAGLYDEFEAAVYPSYYAKVDAEGVIQTPMWFLTGGSIEVSEDGSFEVNATNSYGRTIHAVYTNKKASAITNVIAAADKAVNGKFLKQGQLVIRRNGVEYNTVGQRK